MQPDAPLVTVVEDDAIMGESLVQTLSLEGYRVDWCSSAAHARRALSQTQPHLVVCDIRLPDGRGDDVFLDAASRSPSPPFLFMTAFGDIDQAVRLVKAGAADYITKPFETGAFLERVRLLIERRHIADGHGELGVSEAMRATESLLRRLAAVPTNVLITGPTGAGKEVCARFLHRCSAAADRPFMAVNCGAIPTELIESELFGHERGAFTGATRRHQGYVERARGGVLFLDEIGELPIALQTRLLRLVETRTFTRVGGEDSLPFTARIVCATNADLSAAVAAGRFREDLYFRINVVRVDVPPLKARWEDVPWLMDKFLADLAGRMNARARGFSSIAYGAAVDHDWPGNVRELRNRVERALALSLGDWIMPGDLFPEMATAGDQAGAGLGTLAGAREVAERRMIEAALASAKGHVEAAAVQLGVSRSTLFAKIKRLGVRV